MSGSGSTTDSANLHVQWQGRQHEFAVTFPTGRATLLQIVPSAQQLASQITDAVTEQAAQESQTVSCCAGCGACCRQLVAIPVVEALSLAKLVDALPAERQAVVRQRFAEAIRRLEHEGLLDPGEPPGQRTLMAQDMKHAKLTLLALAKRYYDLQIACPFLEDESCSIHPQRPTVCREHVVTSPAENCARFFETTVHRLEPPVRVSEALARATARVADIESGMIPLTMSLEWAAQLTVALAEPADGLSLLQTLAGEIDEQCTRPFEERNKPVE